LRRLEALEADQHDELQGPTFERALAQAACRVLKIDPKPVLALLPQHARNTLEGVTEGINAPFRDGQGGGGIELPGLVRPVGVIVVLLILAAIALFVVPEGWLARLARPLAGGAPAASAPAAASTPTASVPVVPATPAAVELPAASAAAAPAASVPALASTVATPIGAPAASAPAASTSASGPAPVDEVLAHVAPAPSIPLQVNASADSWVEVVDAHGRTLLSRTVVAGESVGLDGAMPMRVKVGNAGGTHLRLRGDNVDLAPWTRDNVARLEVK